MDITQLFAQEAEAAIDEGLTLFAGLIRIATDDDREAIRRSLKRAAELQAAALLNPGDEEGRRDLVRLKNTLGFLQDKYGFNAELLLRQWLNSIADRVTDRLLDWGLGHLDALERS